MKIFKTLGIGLVIILALGLFVNFYPRINNKNNAQIFEHDIVVEEVEQAVAKNIYPLFQCPCCGKPIAECSCPMAKERMVFIDGVTSVDISKDEAVLAYIKKYGLSSFIDDEEAEKFREKLIEQASEERPIVSLNIDTYDFEDVSQKKGIVSTFFEIKNEGKTDLVINRLETSCGCTSASIVYQNEESPKFNMPGHGINEEVGDWEVVIAPNETAQLKVYYDPNVHGEFRGVATRSIYIYSNDPIDFQKEVKIELNQVE